MELTFAGVVAKFFRVERAVKGLTQPQLAAASGVPQSTISALETGKRAIRSPHVQPILDALGVDLPTMLRRCLQIIEEADRLADSVPLGDVIDTKVRGAVSTRRRRAASATPKTGKGRKRKQHHADPPNELKT